MLELFRCAKRALGRAGSPSHAIPETACTESGALPMKANILPMFACGASLQRLLCVKRVRRKQDDS